MTKFNKGDNVRFIGDKRNFNPSVTFGKVYEIFGVTDRGEAEFIDDNDTSDSWSYISERTEHLFELITDESPRTESDLIANLALRVSDLEERNHPEFFATPVGNEVGASTTQAERIEAVCNEVRDLLIRKNHDYGDSFSKQYAKYGVLSGLIRMDDKMARLDTLINGEQAQVAESVEDSIADLAGYALLTLVELRKKDAD